MIQIDRLMRITVDLKSPIVIGLDPVIERILKVYFDKHSKTVNSFDKVSKVLIDFNKDIIDSIIDIVPAIKPQIAFYEMYGSHDIYAFEKTVEYTKTLLENMAILPLVQLLSYH